MVKSDFIDSIELDGGRLCLDFVNSVANRREKPVPDYLNNFGDLVTWGVRLAIVTVNNAKQLDRRAEKHPKEALAFFKEIIEFRENLYKLFYTLMNSEKVPSPVLDKFNEQVARCFSKLEIKQTKDGFEEGYQLDPDDFFRILLPVVNDSYEFLLSQPGARLKECPSCGWLFYDSTKNGKRRWCSMKSCGSNVKALEWYRRKRQEAAGRRQK